MFMLKKIRRTQATKTDPRFLELKTEVWNEVYQEYLEVRK